jgi:hypothetical protein
MSWLATLLIGFLVGAFDGIGIFFAPGERYKVEILLAATLKGILVSVITALTLSTRRSSWLRAAGFGILYGFAFALVIFLAKGAFKSMDAPYVVPSGIVMGALTGILLWKFAFRRLT